MTINEKLNVCATHYPTFDFYCCYKKQGCFIIEKSKCCDSKIILTDICSKCKEHCDKTESEVK